MKTYPVCRRLMLWHERFIKSSINRYHAAAQQVGLRRISALFFGRLAAASICLFVVSFQVCAADGDIFAQEGINPTVDVPTVIPGVIPIEVDLDDEAAMKSTDSSVTSPTYVDLGRQIETLSQAADLVFHGQVTDVEYQEAMTDADGSFPITYVTFSIFEVWQGRFDAKEIVLMMAGVGWTQQGIYATSSDLPILAEGDELVIFLTQGKVNGPDYLHHFFVLNGSLYDDLSHEIVRDESNGIWRGEDVSKKEILERPLGVGTLRLIRENTENVGSNSQRGGNKISQRLINIPTVQGYWPLSVQDFSGLLQQKVQSSKLRQQTGSKNTVSNTAVQSANKDIPLFISSEVDAVRRKK